MTWPSGTLRANKGPTRTHSLAGLLVPTPALHQHAARLLRGPWGGGKAPRCPQLPLSPLPSDRDGGATDHRFRKGAEKGAGFCTTRVRARCTWDSQRRSAAWALPPGASYTEPPTLNHYTALHLDDGSIKGKIGDARSKFSHNLK